MLYAIPYIFIALTCGFLSLVEYRTENYDTRKIYDVCCIALLFLFFGFRGFVFTDWVSYYETFTNCDLSNLYSPGKGDNTEIGFTILMLLCKSIINNYQFLVLVTTGIDLYLLVRFLKRRVSYLPLALMLYLAMGGLIMQVNLLRNTISILIFVNALEYLEKREPVKYFSLCLLALSFHWSSILYFPLYFFLHRQISKWIFLTIFIIGNIVLILKIPIFTSLVSFCIGLFNEQISTKIDQYTGLFDYSSTFSIGFIERFFTGIMVFCYYDKLKEIRKENIIFINSLLLYFAMFYMLSQFDEIARRMSNLFQYSYWILWYDLIKCFYYKTNKWLFIFFVGIYCILKIYGTAHSPINAYDNVLTGAKSYQERIYQYNKITNEEH